MSHSGLDLDTQRNTDFALIQRITLNELAKWRIDDSLIEFPKDTGEIDKGLSTISRAFLAATANMRSSSTEFGDGETGLEPCGENLLRKVCGEHRIYCIR